MQPCQKGNHIAKQTTARLSTMQPATIIAIMNVSALGNAMALSPNTDIGTLPSPGRRETLRPRTVLSNVRRPPCTIAGIAPGTVPPGL
ncbi:hypothetical protein PRZ48_002405 [Zasmidium cellare]|uniref:Uncharacterized protein n=1 Tax=Zasmidium cellare TaxID=395010 RepID=A0ABR0F3Y9_ZASCE|nr:hypothetical protein PRZ48_002405 [Zasmidium cellare]